MALHFAILTACFRLRNFLYRSLPPLRRTKPKSIKVHSMHELASSTSSIADSITFSFSEKLHIEKKRRISSISAYRKVSLDCSRESDNSLYQIHCAPKQFMDSSVNSDDIFMCNSRESDRISLSSTASSTGYPRRPDSSGATPLYMPMNMLNSKGAHSPCSNNKVSVRIIVFTSITIIKYYMCFTAYTTKETTATKFISVSHSLAHNRCWRLQ